jgi:hypothetical protein
LISSALRLVYVTISGHDVAIADKIIAAENAAPPKKAISAQIRIFVMLG